ncbi:MAG: GWxTD domain-containing protein [Bacteroidales bacterium]|jgi:GWxTD domain-containing protein|nr:GWxTD domain-containing protein [Bacteroidales bacterium]
MKPLKKNLLVILLILTVLCSLTAQNLRVNVNYLLFDYQNDTAYIELQFLFGSEGLIFALNNEEKYQATTHVDVTFLSNEKTAIEKQFSFSSAEYEDTLTHSGRSFYDLRRILLPYGKYTMKVQIKDINNVHAEPLSFEKEIVAQFAQDKIYLSDIQPVAMLSRSQEKSRFVKNGYDYTPYFSDFYPQNINIMLFMVEIYRSKQCIADSVFKIVTFLSTVNGDQAIDKRFLKEKIVANDDFYPIYQSFAIDSLPSGNYRLNIQIKDLRDSLYASKERFFQRSNPSVEPQVPVLQIDSLPYDTLKRYLDYIAVIANSEEQMQISNFTSKDYQAILDFFEIFWRRRNPQNPWQEWGKYYTMVQQVNATYTTLTFPGFRTDRGRYYLKYGPPNDIEYQQGQGRGNAYDNPYGHDYRNPHEKIYDNPYEIWWYNEFPATNQTNIYFIFADVDMVTKDFKMVHSNANGERADYIWKAILEEDGILTPSENRSRNAQFENGYGR